MIKRLYAVLGLALSLSAMCTGSDKTFDFRARGGYATSGVAVVATEWLRARQGYSLLLWESNIAAFGKAAFVLGGVPADSGLTFGFGARYPATSLNEHLYGASPWFAARVFDTATNISTPIGYAGYPQVGINTGPTEDGYVSDPIWQTSVEDTAYDSTRSGFYKRPMNHLGYDDDGDGKIDEDELDGLDNDHDWVRSTDDIGADGVPDSSEVGCKGRYDPILNPDPAFDDYNPAAYDSCHPRADGSYRLKDDKTIYTELNGIPDHGEPHVDEDYGALSDNDLYTGATDTNAVVHEGPFPALKIFYKSYAWKSAAYDGILPIDFAFINVGHYRWDSVYVGLFADEDVGPVDVPTYYTHNYAAYDSATHTAYVDNPVDSGSTPMGVTILRSSLPLGQVGRTMFHWWNIGGGPGSNDSSIWAWTCGNAFGGHLIQPNQSKDSLSDTRYLISIGPFGPISSGDTVHMRLAFVAGNCVQGCAGSMFDHVNTAQQVFGESQTEGVRVPAHTLPKSFALYQCYPNPFNPSTTISYSLPTASRVTLTVFDILGRETGRLVNGEMEQAGMHQHRFDASELGSGVYFYKITAGTFSDVKKAVLLK